ncbi:MAG: aromatic ring-hydroxylating dioxygenase subunit alpha [Rhodospirillaceae bacterium]|nr:MAG: aromatic ring-hydroxylating dioxygenase subunit alpha [Rhodospirillaceae bacterium]
MAQNAHQTEVRTDFVPADHYISPEFLRLEKEHMWPRVWQVACREEELPNVGDYVTYNIMDESIVVVRASDSQLKAYFNVCPHRGRRLTAGCGQLNRFHCKFHGWQWDLEGSVLRVLDRNDWAGCANFGDADLHLREVRVDTWAGWVFINMDSSAEPLADYLSPVQDYLDPFEIQKMRYRWYVSVRVPCNWKTGLEAFNEAYHVVATHPQLLPTYGDVLTRNRTFGRHGNFYYPGNPECPLGAPAPHLGIPAPKDLRPNIVAYYDMYNTTLRAIFSERDVEAVRRLMTEVEPGTPPGMMMTKMMDFQREAAVAAGAGWPDISMKQLADAGTDWHVFPNLIMLPYPDGVLAYRALPDATDPDTCIFEVYALQRYAPGAEPKLERKYFHGDGEWRNFKSISIILQQDFDNMGEVQRGMRSRGFKGARTNPLQEATVSNFHRAVCQYFHDDAASPDCHSDHQRA